MKVCIDVKNRKEGNAIRAGMADPEVRAFVIVVGVLSGLPTDRARARVLGCVADQVDEDTARRQVDRMG